MANEVILVVEDEALVGLELQESLMRAGYKVPEVVISYEGVMPAVVKYKPDLVIMDINLNSFSDGVAAVQRMKILGDLPVLYLTAYRDEETRKRALSTGPADYLVKPITEETLLESVAKALDLVKNPCK